MMRSRAEFDGRLPQAAGLLFHLDGGLLPSGEITCQQHTHGSGSPERERLAGRHGFACFALFHWIPFAVISCPQPPARLPNLARSGRICPAQDRNANRGLRRTLPILPSGLLDPRGGMGRAALSDAASPQDDLRRTETGQRGLDEVDTDKYGQEKPPGACQMTQGHTRQDQGPGQDPDDAFHFHSIFKGC